MAITQHHGDRHFHQWQSWHSTTQMNSKLSRNSLTPASQENTHCTTGIAKESAPTLERRLTQNYHHKLFEQGRLGHQHGFQHSLANSHKPAKLAIYRNTPPITSNNWQADFRLAGPKSDCESHVRQGQRSLGLDCPRRPHWHTTQLLAWGMENSSQRTPSLPIMQQVSIRSYICRSTTGRWEAWACRGATPRKTAASHQNKSTDKYKAHTVTGERKRGHNKNREGNTWGNSSPGKTVGNKWGNKTRGNNRWVAAATTRTANTARHAALTKEETWRNVPTFTLWHKDVTDTVRPSSSAPGQCPLGWLNRPGAVIKKRIVNKWFYFNRRRAKRLILIRAQSRRAWRYYKRTRLRDRARQVAKVILRESSLTKREALTRNTKQRIRNVKRGFNRISLTTRDNSERSSQLWGPTRFHRSGIAELSEAFQIF